MEVNDKIIKELFKTAKMPFPENVSETDILAAITNIKSKEDERPKTPRKTNEQKQEETEQKNNDFTQAESSAPNNTILVIDDIGVVTYQLKVLLTEVGYQVQVAKDIFGALNTFLKERFDFMIMDLFVSTEQEGFTLLAEAKKIITKNNLPTKIIVITASNKTENKIKCLNGGADIFIKKEAGWQDKLLELIENHKFGSL